MGFWTSATLVAATLAAGLMAGLFAAFWYAVMPGLARASDLAFVDGMQRINVAILNGWFGLCFAGALVFPVLAAVLHAGAERRSVLPWIVAGAVLYLVVLVVTFAANVPLNDRLDAAGDPAPDRRPARGAGAVRGGLGALERRPDAGLHARVRLPDLGAGPARPPRPLIPRSGRGDVQRSADLSRVLRLTLAGSATPPRRPARPRPPRGPGRRRAGRRPS